MLKTEIDKKKLEAIKKDLLKGDMSAIAAKLNLSKGTVYKCMTGQILNLKIVDCAIRKANENKSLFSKIASGLSTKKRSIR